MNMPKWKWLQGGIHVNLESCNGNKLGYSKKFVYQMSFDWYKLYHTHICVYIQSVSEKYQWTHTMSSLFLQSLHCTHGIVIDDKFYIIDKALAACHDISWFNQHLWSIKCLEDNTYDRHENLT